MSQAGNFPRLKIGGLLGYAAIWAFFGIFLIYPLIRLFYDAFTTTEGVFTLANFIDFFNRFLLLKSLVNSILLALAPSSPPPLSESLLPTCSYDMIFPGGVFFPIYRSSHDHAPPRRGHGVRFIMAGPGP